jgi:hypothetical protein
MSEAYIIETPIEEAIFERLIFRPVPQNVDRRKNREEKTAQQEPEVARVSRSNSA